MLQSIMDKTLPPCEKSKLKETLKTCGKNIVDMHSESTLFFSFCPSQHNNKG